MTPRQQRLKWIVYALLIVNFAVYVVQDAESAPYVLGPDPEPFEWLRAYVTSLDVASWLVLLLLFELETSRPGNRPLAGPAQKAVHAVRLVCCVAIAHTIAVNALALQEFRQASALTAAADACAFADGERTVLRNREYIDLDDRNCRDVARGPDFYAIGDEGVITDREGLREGLVLAWTDLVESVAWLLVVLLTEWAVRVMSRVPADRRRTMLLQGSKGLLYATILGIALYWGYKDQWLYLWDELLWIFGFAVIDRNLLGWKSRPSRAAAV